MEKFTLESLIEDVPMSIRLKNALIQAGFKYLADLKDFPLKCLESLRGFGKKTITELHDILWKVNASLDVRPHANLPIGKRFVARLGRLNMFFTEEEFHYIMEFVKRRTYFTPNSATPKPHNQS